jgi:hypothetical protein
MLTSPYGAQRGQQVATVPERDAVAGKATIGLVLDCADPERLATFWAAALGYDYLGTYANHALLLPRGQPGPKLVLQGVPEPKRYKNRMHLDVIVDDIDRCAARLESLGAVRDPSSAHEELGHRCWGTMPAALTMGAGRGAGRRGALARLAFPG